MTDFATGAHVGDGRRLDDASSRFEALGCRLWAAEAATLASAAYRGKGFAARALAAATRGAQLVAELGSPTTPILERAADPQALTRRGHEIAHLAASGMTDQEIADRLVVSIRTVQSHLYNAYAKLDVQGRRDLAALLAGHAPPWRR